MTKPLCKLNQRLGKLRGGIILVLLVLVFGLSGVAQAATIPFTFEVTFDTFVVGGPPQCEHFNSANNGPGLRVFCTFWKCDLLGSRNNHLRNVTFG
jgi:hypothetical protein